MFYYIYISYLLKYFFIASYYKNHNNLKAVFLTQQDLIPSSSHPLLSSLLFYRKEYNLLNSSANINFPIESTSLNIENDLSSFSFVSDGNLKFLSNFYNKLETSTLNNHSVSVSQKVNEGTFDYLRMPFYLLNSSISSIESVPNSDGNKPSTNMDNYSSKSSYQYLLSHLCEYSTKDPFADICLPISFYLFSSVSLSNYWFFFI
jgi:hypothetical protein